MVLSSTPMVPKTKRMVLPYKDWNKADKSFDMVSYLK